MLACGAFAGLLGAPGCDDVGTFGPGVSCGATQPCRAPLVCVAGRCAVPPGETADASVTDPSRPPEPDATVADAPADAAGSDDAPATVRGTVDGAPDPGEAGNDGPDAAPDGVPDAAPDGSPDASACIASQAALCGRSPDGIVCAFSDPAGPWTAPRLVAPAFSDGEGWNASPSLYATIQFPDVDGDGTTDVCGRSRKGIVCALGQATGGFAPATSWTSEFADGPDPTGWQQSPSSWATIRFPDLNGDGRADICGQSATAHWCALSTGKAFAPGAAWGAPLRDLAGATVPPTVWGTVQYADLDGDRRDDFCVRGPSGVHCALSSGLGFGFLQPWTDGFSDPFGGDEPTIWPTVQIADVSGDGLADLCGRGFFQLVCLLGRGGMREQPPNMPRFFNEMRVAQFGDDFGFSQGISNHGSIQSADINGDGRLDICGKAPDGLWCVLSKGFAGVVEATRWTDAVRDDQGWDSPLHALTLRFADLNGDGKDDLCGRHASGITCALSNGKDAFTPGPSLAAFRDADGFARVSSASTIWFGTFVRGSCHPSKPARGERRLLEIAIASGIVLPD